ncbi:MAG: hypothetical protein GKR89_33370 [Candidatus Latescibacteria bacterium]|nr:hypothetical protein [Candidatus Latescibacterota bacterium]
MQITDVRIYIEPGQPQQRPVSNRGGMEKVPPGLSGLFTHAEGMGQPAPLPQGWEEACHDPTFYPTFNATLRLVTDGPLDAYCTFASGFDQGELLYQARHFKLNIGPLLLGVDAFDREYVFQRLWYTQRFYYTGRQVLDMVDRMLWDLFSRHARQPIYRLLGATREKIPAYRNYGGRSIDDMVAGAVQVKEEGYKGAKDHSYRGVQGNSDLAREVRAAVGDDFILLHDPVESYTYDEAVKIGRVLEKYNFTWIEEPLQDYDMLGLQKLCATLDLPVLALEWIGHLGGQPFQTAPYLAWQAVDIARQRGIGITGQVKQAQLAEAFDVEVHGGDPHVILSIANDPLFETVGQGGRPAEEEVDCRGTAYIEDGYMSIAWNDRVPDEPDWERLQRNALGVV